MENQIKRPRWPTTPFTPEIKRLLDALKCLNEKNIFEWGAKEIDEYEKITTNLVKMLKADIAWTRMLQRRRRRERVEKYGLSDDAVNALLAGFKEELAREKAGKIDYDPKFGNKGFDEEYKRLVAHFDHVVQKMDLTEQQRKEITGAREMFLKLLKDGLAKDFDWTV